MSPSGMPVQDAADARLLAVDEGALRLIDLVLAEDVGPGDWTTRWTVAPRARVDASLVAGAAGVLSGLALAAAVFRRLNPRVEVETHRAEGDAVGAGDLVASIHGPARAILTGRRTALAFLQRLSGVATLTRRYVEALKGTGAELLGSDDGTPGWRLLEDAALRAGGARLHTMGLSESLVVDAGHVSLTGSIAEALKRLREQASSRQRIEVVVTDEAGLTQAARAGADVILLAAGDPEVVRAAARALERPGGRARPLLAVRADVNPAGARALAEAGARAVLPVALPRRAPPLSLTLTLGAR